MESLNEENSHNEVSLDQIDNDINDNEINNRPAKDKSCAERSDSGFSDSSNVSNTQIISNHTSLPQSLPVVEENNNDSALPELDDDVNGKISVNKLKEKLEKMAQAVTTVPETESIRPVRIGRKTVNIVPKDIETTVEWRELHRTVSANFDQPKYVEKSQRVNLARSASLQHKKIIEKEPIMKSDFTNTVKMRKKSLESNILRDKSLQLHSPRVLLETSGKVSKLLQRFNVDDKPVDDSMKAKAIDHIFMEKIPIENAVIECDSTPITAQAITHQQVMIKSDLTKARAPSSPIVSSEKSNGQRAPSKAINRNVERRSVFERLSPTRNPNAKPANKNSSIEKMNSNKKSIKSSNAVTTTTSTKSTAAAVVTSTIVTSNTQKSSATAYAAFNRTSPVRLSGRVKEVTDRLSAPKQIRKPIPVQSNTTIVAATKKISRGQAIANLSESSNDESIETMSIEAAEMTTTTAVMTTLTQQINETTTMTNDKQHHLVSDKTDGDFAIKSKMSENFRKASAFWKAT